MFFFQFLCNHVTRVRVPITICTDSTGVRLKQIESFSFSKRKIYCTTISLVKIKNTYFTSFILQRTVTLPSQCQIQLSCSILILKYKFISAMSLFLKELIFQDTEPHPLSRLKQTLGEQIIKWVVFQQRRIGQSFYLHVCAAKRVVTWSD